MCWFRCLSFFYIHQACFNCLDWALTKSGWAGPKSSSAWRDSSSQLSCHIEMQHNHQVSWGWPERSDSLVLCWTWTTEQSWMQSPWAQRKWTQEGVWLNSMGPESCIGRGELLGSSCWLLRGHLPSAQDWDHHGSCYFLLASSDSFLYSFQNLWIPFEVFVIIFCHINRLYKLLF